MRWSFMTGPRSLEELLLDARGFQGSRVLLTALELDLFSRLGEGATAETLAERASTDARATGMLLHALVALGALEKHGELFRCTPGSAQLGSARDGLMHMVNLWETWSTLTACVKSGTSVTAGGSEGRRGPDWTESFIAAMHARASAEADAMVAAVGASPSRRMLDVGGGAATFAIAFARANPELRAVVLDLGSVVPIAERHIREAGLADRVEVRVGDLRKDDFGQGFDLVLVSAICHMLDEAENRDLFARCAAAMVRGGRLVIRDFILEPDRTAPRHAALFALNMLVGTRRGNSYTEAEYRAWMEETGFVDIARLDPGGDLIVGRRGTRAVTLDALAPGGQGRGGRSFRYQVRHS